MFRIPPLRYFHPMPFPPRPAHALRHRRPLDPVPGAPPVPASTLQRLGHTVRDVAEVKRLEASGFWPTRGRTFIGSLAFSLPSKAMRHAAPTPSIRVSKVHKAQPVVTQDPAHLSKHRYQLRHVLLDGWLKADLPVYMVITKCSPVWRASNTAMHTTSLHTL